MENLPRVAVAIIIERGDKVLMGKRKNTAGAGNWGLPGGHLEFKESIDSCMHRELQEETGVVPTKYELLGIINDTNRQDSAHYIHFVYLVKDFTGKILTREPEKCEKWEWKEKNNLPTPIFIGQQKAMNLYLSAPRKFFVDD